MKNSENKQTEEKALQENWPLNAADANQNPENYDRDEEEEESEDDESGDWGDVDPAGGPAPSAPGSAV
ncbi:hypothetical protein ACFPVY_15650 [Flavobacterium qiangtangense]|uniref:Uncharacterized protein n=1 Tax=Flavobacterium qiangtangense TaxID=1442595 RepID=A0ABW1PT81_9FLAO